MVTVHRLDGGQPYAVEVRPDAGVVASASAEPGVVEIRFTDSSPTTLTLILSVEVARQLFGQPVGSLSPSVVP
jgi:hypothetical protein